MSSISARLHCWQITLGHAGRAHLSLSLRAPANTHKNNKMAKGSRALSFAAHQTWELTAKNYMHGATRARRRISAQFGEFTKRETHFLRPQIIQHYAAPAFPHLTAWLELVKHANDSLLLLLMDVR